MAIPEGLLPAPGSFRDPAGSVFLDGRYAFRSINPVFQKDWDAMQESGFARLAAERRLLLPFEECPALPGSWKSIRSPRLKVISYPYEWCFSQLKDAALLTLTLLGEALRHGLTLKDASAFNVQFEGAAPVFIDHLSFEVRKANSPWAAYLQFCRHFLAPLALLHYRGGELGRLSSLWVEGLPLELVSSLLPLRSRFSFSMQIHLHLHARLQSRHGDARKSAEAVKKISVKPDALEKLCQSLTYALEDLRLPAHKTEWGDYYSDTNYSEAAGAAKAQIVERAAREHPGALALDLGANTGEYSRLLAGHYDQVVAADLDFMAVERHYLGLKKSGAGKITPLVLDLTNPSPGLGFGNEERTAFDQRFQADMIAALALIHHLTLGAGIPLQRAASYFNCLLKPGGVLVLEFVPFEDSQVQRLMAVRGDSVLAYSLEDCLAAFGQFLSLEGSYPIDGSRRTVLVFKKTN